MHKSLFDQGPHPTCPEIFNLAAHSFANAVPDKTALDVISAPGIVAEHWTYKRLLDTILATATGLKNCGVKKGDRVVLQLGNTSDFPILFFAANAIGAVPVPTSSMLTKDELAYIVHDSAPRLICLGSGGVDPDVTGIPKVCADEIRQMRGLPLADFTKTHRDDPAFMVYTSGTAGKPKGVLHAQRSAWARRMMWDGWYGLTANDRVLHAGAFNWTYTLGAGLTDPWAIGATALIYTGPADKTVWADIAKMHDASIFAAAPGVFRQLLNSDADCASGFANLRHGLSAGEKLPVETRAAWAHKTGKPIFEALGMSEVSTYISTSPTTEIKTGTSGKPQKGRRIAILPETEGSPVPVDTIGLLAVSNRDPGLMIEYWNCPNETAAAFRGEWFLTGDRASMDESGYITYHGRADDLMNAQGYRVSAQEVEEAVQAHPDIIQCAAVELPVRAGVSIISVYYTSVGNRIVDEAALKSHCAGILARYKCPKAFSRLDALPKSANGKLLRRALVQKYGWNEK